MSIGHYFPWLRAWSTALLAVFAWIGAPAQTQPSPTGLRLWLKADAGVVLNESQQITQWEDQSGNGNHATGDWTNYTSPDVLTDELNGLPVVSFTGSNHGVFNLPGVVVGETAAEMFIVVKREPNSSYGFQSILSPEAYYDRYPESDGRIIDYSGAIYTDAGKSLQSLDTYVIYDVAVSPDGKTIRLNGLTQFSEPGPIDPQAISFASNAQLGGYYYLSQMNIAEALVYNRELDGPERSDVITYFQQKYALIQPALPPVNFTGNAFLGGIGLVWQPAVAQQSLFEVQRKGAGDDDASYATLASNLTTGKYYDSSVVAGETYVYRVRTTNGVGQQSDYASSITVTNNASVGGTVPGAALGLWLRADQGVVADNTSGEPKIVTWLDQSGNQNHATTSVDASDFPVLLPADLNGLPVMAFTANNSYFSLPGVAADQTAAEMFIVIKRNAELAGASSGNFLGVLGTHYYSIEKYPDSRGHIIDYTGETELDAGRPIQSLDTYVVYNVAVGQDGKTIRLNGVTQFYQPGPLSVNFPTEGLLGSSGGFKGNIAELLIYRRVIDNTERNDVISYFQQKYAVIQTPAAPINLLIGTELSDAVTLQWQAGAAQQSLYEVQRKAAGEDDAAFISLVGGLPTPSYRDTTAVAGQSYVYRVRTINGVGQQSGFTTLAVNYNPALSAVDMKLWLRADRGVVLQNQDGVDRVVEWQDQSPNGKNAVQSDWNNAPSQINSPSELNGHPVIRFSGGSSGSELYLENVFSGDSSAQIAAEMYFVLKRPDVTSANLGSSFCTFLGDSEAAYPNASGHIIDRAGDIFTDAGKPIQALDTYVIYSVSVGPTGKVVRINGVEQYRQTWPNGTRNIQLAGSGRFRSPRFDDYANYGANSASFEINIPEVIFYDRLLNATERSAAIAYLQQRYALIPDPAVPVNVAVNPNFSGGAFVQWDPSAAQQATFEVQRRDLPSGDFVTIASQITKPYYFDSTVVPGQSYDYQVKATNGMGVASQYSVPLTLSYNPVANSGITPAGLQLWLKADAGVSVNESQEVTRWLDQSGNSNTAIWPAPGYYSYYNNAVLLPDQLNGLPAVAFGPYSGAFDLPGVVADQTSAELFVVVKHDPGTSNGFQSILTDGLHQDQYPATNGHIIDSSGGVYTDAGLPGQSLDTYTVYNVAVSPNGKAIRLNGLNQYTVPGPIDPTIIRFPAYAQLGNQYSTFYGKIAEIFVYNRELNGPEHAATIAYLQQKYNLIPTPTAPSAVETQILLSSSIRVDWKRGAAYQTVFELQRAVGTGAYVTIASGLTGTSFTDTDVIDGVEYRYQVRAANALGQQSAYSVASASSTIVYAAPSSSVAVTGLALWLRADVGIKTQLFSTVLRITEWRDQSGKGNDAVPPAVGSGPSLTTGAQFNGQPVVNFVSPSNGALSLPSLINPTAAAGDLFVVLQGSGQFAQFYRYHSTNLGPTQVSDNFFSTVQTTFVPNLSTATPYLYNVAGGTDYRGIWLNGFNKYLSLTNSVGVLAEQGGYPNYLGRSYDNSGSRINGSIAEVLFFERVLTDVERAQVVAYLQARYLVIPEPPTPAGLVVEQSLTSLRAIVKWQPILGQEVVYDVMRKADSETEFTVVSLGQSDSGYGDSNVVLGNHYTYRVVARNGVGVVSPVPAEASITVSTQQPVLPAAGMKLWLRADAGVVVTADNKVQRWFDQSPQANDAAGSYPQYPAFVTNGINATKPAIYLNAGPLVVEPMLNSATQGEYFLVFRNYDSYYMSSPVRLHQNHSLAVYGVGYGTPKITDSFLSQSNRNFALGINTNTWNLYDVSAAPGAWSAGVNGVTRYSTTDNVVPNLENGASPLGFFRTDYGSYVAELVVYDRVLTDQERAAVVNYLQTKYAVIPDPLPPSNLDGYAPQLVAKVELRWQAGGVQSVSYEIQRSVSGDNDFATVATGIMANLYNDTTVQAGVTYQYRVRAVNGLGVNSAFTNIWEVAVPVSSAEIPSSGVRLWLRANQTEIVRNASGYVTEWLDQSGAGRHGLAQTKNSSNNVQWLPAAINGQPALHYNGSEQFFFNNAMQGVTAGEMFIYHRKNSPLTGIDLSRANSSGRSLWGNYSDTRYPATNGKIYDYFGRSGSIANFTPTESIYDFHLYHVAASNTEWVAWINDAEQYRASQTYANFPTSLTLGYNNYYGAYFLGDISEVLIYDRVLSAVERAQVEGYFAGKYSDLLRSPVFSPLPGRYESQVSVSLGTSSSGAAIYYAMGDMMPDPSTSPLYSGPITFTESTKLNALSFRNEESSTVVSGLYSVGVAPAQQTSTSGLAAAYYQNADFTGGSVKRIDATINHPYYSYDYRRIPPNTASVVWTGSLTAQFTEDYTIYVRSDGKPKLWLGNALLIDGSSQTGNEELQTTLRLQAGQSYPIRIEYLTAYAVGTSSDEIKLSWSSLSIAKEIIPVRQLSSDLSMPDFVQTPIATPAADTYADTVTFSLSTPNTPTAQIYYTLDGSIPTAASTRYTTPITTQQNLTLKAAAFLSGYNDSGLLVANYVIDNAGPVLSNPQFNADVIPALIKTAGIFSVGATDSSGVKKVEFRIDGQLLGTDSYAANGFETSFVLKNFSDGPHSLTIQAWDNVNVPSAILTIPISLALPSPAAPVITSPANGTKLNRSALTVRGTAEPNATVTLLKGGAPVGTTTAGTDGSFAIDVTLTAGVNELSALAQNRNPVPSATSALVSVTYDNTVPGAPSMLTLRSRSGGRNQLDWRAPVAGLSSGYYVFRSTDPISDNTVFNPANAIGGLIQSLSYTDTPPADGRYYYRVVTALTIGQDVTLSPPSNQVDGFSDRTGPTATVSFQPLGQRFDAAGNRYGIGLVKALITVSEPLAAAPFFNITTAGGFPLFVDLASEGGNSYSGIINLVADTASGPADATFSAYDVAGNRGTEVTLTTPFTIDTDGPVGTGLTPVTVEVNGSLTELPAYDSVRNDTTTSLSWRLTLDEAPQTGTTPEITATFSSNANVVLPLTVTDAGDSDSLTWLATLTLPANAGNDTENLTIGFSATDDLQNIGDTITSPHVIQIYKGALPPLGVPANLTGEARPAGAVHLAWSPVTGAAGYVLQEKAPGQPDYMNLLVLTAVEFEHTYTPAIDGDHSYRVASVRTANGQQSTSGWSNVVTAQIDRVDPEAPSDLVLEVIPQGVKATWTAPATGFTDVSRYALYRSNAAITDVSSLTPIIPTVSKNAAYAVDPQPVGTAPHYALVSVDAAGNRSAPAPAFANVGLLPVRSISLTQLDAAAPVLTWTPAPGSVLDGFNLLVNGTPIESGGNTLLPTSTLTYTDTAYVSGDRTYTVRAVSGASNRERALLLPDVSFTITADSEIKRGLMNIVTVHVENNSASALLDNVIRLNVGGLDHFAANPFDLASGASADVPVIVGGYEDLPEGTVPTVLTLIHTPADGETVTLTRNTSVRMAEGALTAEVLPGEFLRGGTGTARFKLTNPSALPVEFIVARSNGNAPSDQARLKLLDAQLGVLSSTALKVALGDNIVALPNGTSVVRVPAGATYTSPQFTLPVPLTAAAQITVALEIDWVYSNYGQPTQVTLKGPRAQVGASTQQTSYSAELTSVTPVNSNGDQPIEIKGRALWRGVDPLLPSALAANSPIIVYIELEGFIRQQSLVTDISGAFSYNFVPGPTEKGGIYQVWASHPEITSPPDSPTTFTINRVTVSPQVMTYRSPRNYRQVLPVTVRTGKGTTVHNLRAELVGTLPEAVSFSTTPVATILAEQTVSLPLSVVGLASTPTSIDFGTLQFRVVSDNEADAASPFLWATLMVNYQFTEANPYIEATPNLLDLGVQPGQTTSETFVLKNTGYAPLEAAVVSLLSADENPLPTWIRLQTAATLGAIEVGGTKNVVISAAPPVDVVAVDTVYFAKLNLAGANGTPQDFYVTVTVSPSGQGDALFKVVDPYYQLVTSGPNPSFNGIPNASVVLEKESSTGISNLTQSRQSDANGEVSFSDLPAGRYKLRINAEKHEPYIARISIKPGVVYAEQISLTYNPVTVTWEVVPVTFQDRYEIVLTSTFVTDVPVPVIVVEPGSLTLPQMCAGQVYNGEFRITNHGLIDAEQVELPLPKSDEFFSYEFLGSFGDKIKAKQTVTVPYRVKCLKPLPDACPETTASIPYQPFSYGGLASLSRSASSGMNDFLGSGGSVPGNGVCGTYGIAFGIPYLYKCPWNGQIYVGIKTFYFSKSFGDCAPGSGSGTRTDYWQGSGGYTSAPGYGPGGGATSTAPQSDDCYPGPNDNPNGGPNGGPGGGGGGGGGGGPNGPGGPGPRDPDKGGGGPPNCGPNGCPPEPPDEEDPCKKPEDDSSTDEQVDPAGCWVNLVTRQFHDSVIDLTVNVPGGFVNVSRDFNNRRWSFAMFDDIFALKSTVGTACELRYRDQVFRLGGQPAVSFPSAIQPASAAPIGVYLLNGAGKDQITKNADGTLTWTDGQFAERRYDANGRLTNVWHRDALLFNYIYDGSGMLTTITDRDDITVLTFTYTGGNLTKVQDYFGREVNYTYDAEGRLASSTNIMGVVESYTYDTWWHLTQIRDHRPDTLADSDLIETVEYRLFPTSDTPTPPPARVIFGHPTLGLQNRGMVTKVSNTAGESRTYAFQYNEGAKTFYSHTTSASGRVEESLFDADGHFISRSVNGETSKKLEENANTRVVTNGLNERHTFEYDDRRRMTRHIYPDGSFEAFEYANVSNKITKHTTRTGLITTYTYGPGRQYLLLSQTDAAGTAMARTTSYEYYPITNGGFILVKEKTFPDGRKIGYEYNKFRQVTREYNVADPLRQTLSTYDARGMLTSTTDANGGVTTYAYDANLFVTEITNPLQEKTINTYRAGRLYQVEVGRVDTTPGRITRYRFDAKGRQSAVVRVDSAGVEQVVTAYAYDADGRLLSEADALGQTVTYRYDANSNQTVVSVPNAQGGRSESFTAYDSMGRVVERINAAGTRTTTTYDQAGRISLITEAAGTSLARITSYTYDGIGRVIESKFTDLTAPAISHTSTSSYDLLGRVIATGGNRDYPVTTLYDSSDRVIGTTDALGRSITNDYDAFGRLSFVRLNGALVASFTYDRRGNVLSSTDGEGNHRHFHYDALNRPTHEAIPLTSTETIPAEWWSLPAYVKQATAYNQFNQPISVTRYTVDGSTINLAVTTTTYDDFGRVAAQTDPAGMTVTYTYDATDNVTQINYPPVVSSGQLVPTAETFLRSPSNASLVEASVDRVGNSIQYVYDSALRVVQQINSLGGVVSTTYDALGRVATSSDSANNITRIDYNSFNQPVRIAHPDHVAGTRERIETFRYDTYGKLLEKSGAGDYPMVYRYDAVGNLTEMQDGNGKITRWTYTDRDQVSTKTYADATLQAYTYDLTGRLLTRRDALNRTTSYSYNAYGLLTLVDYPTDPDVTFTYDQQGRRLRMTDGSGSTAWVYNAIGRPLTEFQGRSHRTLTYSYDAQNLRTDLDITSSDVGVKPWHTGYTYDNAGRLKTVLDDRLPVAAPYSYVYSSNASLVASITSPTGLKTNKAYDDQDRLLSTTALNSELSTLNSFAYTYDVAGQRNTEATATGRRDFTYDAFRQLTQSLKTVAGAETDRHTYTFDSIGNRLEVGRVILDEPSALTSYTPNSVNQYSAITGTQAETPTYDLNGNTLNALSSQLLALDSVPLTFKYNEENRLIEAMGATQRSVYIYDGLGRRIERQDYTGTAPSAWTLVSTHRFVYDGWRVMEELDATYTTVRSYTRGVDLSGSSEGAGGIGGLLALSLPNGSTFTTASYLYDGNGNVTDLAFDDGTIAAHYEYSPFGERLVATGTWAETNPYQFSSKERDPLTGFNYFGYRFYNPSVGRWLSRDPLDEEGGVGLYVMVGNDPIADFDALGLYSRKGLLKVFCKLKPCDQAEFLKKLGTKKIQFFKDDGKNVRLKKFMDSNGVEYTKENGEFSGTADEVKNIIYMLNGHGNEETLASVFHESDHIDNDNRLALPYADALKQREANEIRAYTAEADFAYRAGLSIINPNLIGNKGPDAAAIKQFVFDQYVKGQTADRKPRVKQPKAPKPPPGAPKPPPPKRDRFIEETHKETPDGTEMSAADFVCP